MAIRTKGLSAVESATHGSSTSGVELNRRRRQSFVPYLLLTPFFLLLLGFFVAPLVYAFKSSLYASALIGGEKFVGLRQYGRAFQDQELRTGLVNVAGFGIVYLVALVLLATTAALALDARESRFSRLAMFVPFAVPSAVAALMWGYLYSQDFGPLQTIGDIVGFDSPDILAPGTVTFAIANIVLWQFLGYNMLILYVALRSVSRELYEAAEVDGASPRQVAWYIKLPLLRPAIGLVVFFSFVGSLQLFSEPKILSASAPDVVNASWTPNMYAYGVAFIQQDVSYSAALSFVLGGIAFVSTAVFMLVQRGRNR